MSEEQTHGHMQKKLPPALRKDSTKANTYPCKEGQNYVTAVTAADAPMDREGSP